MEKILWTFWSSVEPCLKHISYAINILNSSKTCLKWLSTILISLNCFQNIQTDKIEEYFIIVPTFESTYDIIHIELESKYMKFAKKKRTNKQSFSLVLNRKIINRNNIFPLSSHQFINIQKLNLYNIST